MISFNADFFKGAVAGALVSLLVFGVVGGMYFHNRKVNERTKEMIEYAEKSIEVEKLREDYRSRDPVEFLEDPGVRRAADGAASEFERKRDEAVFRLRSRSAD